MTAVEGKANTNATQINITKSAFSNVMNLLKHRGIFLYKYTPHTAYLQMGLKFTADIKDGGMQGDISQVPDKDGSGYTMSITVGY